jgi:hypothetical protein
MKDIPMKSLPVMLIAAAATILVGSLSHAQSPQTQAQDSVLTYHGGADRSGNYKVLGTREVAPS